MYPTGILKNEKTGRYHPIPFRWAPLPGGKDADMTAQRYKSIGHHTDGFDTIEEAKANISKNEACDYVGMVWNWDGEGTSAMTQWFGP